MTFEPNYTITPISAASLMRIEANRQAMVDLPVNTSMMAALRETARLTSTHYSTAIEGNLLTQAEVKQVVAAKRLTPRQRDEKEVIGYFDAVAEMEKVATRIVAGDDLTELDIQTLHGFAMGGGKKRPKPTPYRDGQNVIRDARSGFIVYMPPEAQDVPKLMDELVWWVNATSSALPCPLQAAIAHYQFATIHPYFDGNGRTARLLTTLILHAGGYGLKGIYSLEEYYAKNLAAYYRALTVGPSHNYYRGRAKADITPWIDYFLTGAAESFETAVRRAREEMGLSDQSRTLRRLDPRQRQALELFRQQATIASRDIEALLGITQRTARNVLAQWTHAGFLTIRDPSNKARKYALAADYEALLTGGRG